MKTVVIIILCSIISIILVMNLTPDVHEGSKPYTPSRIEWLALKCDARYGFLVRPDLQGMSITYRTVSTPLQQTISETQKTVQPSQREDLKEALDNIAKNILNTIIVSINYNPAHTSAAELQSWSNIVKGQVLTEASLMGWDWVQVEVENVPLNSK